jgi:hypothetical protein
LLKADAMILGSPTYFAAVSADLKALIERAGYVAYANGHTFSGKIGAAAVAVRRGGATHVYDTINHMFQMSRMIMPCSTYWNMGYGLNKGEVNEDEEGLANMRHLGKSIDWHSLSWFSKHLLQAMHPRMEVPPTFTSSVSHPLFLSSSRRACSMCTDTVTIYRVSIPFSFMCLFTSSMGTSSLWKIPAARAASALVFRAS